MPLCSPQRCGCAFQSGSVHISGDAPAALILEAGTVTTPDTADMSFSGTVRLRISCQIDTIGVGTPPLIQKADATRELMLYVYPPAGLNFSTQASAGFTDTGFTPPIPLGSRHEFGVEFTFGSLSATVILDDVRTTANFSTLPVGPDTTAPVILGYPGITGRIYWAQLEKTDGTVIWRFDANDYPGTGTVYTDPRGRVWTLSTASAIRRVDGDRMPIRFETYERVATEATPSDTRPTAPWPGMKVYCTDNKTEYVWDGLRWSFVRRRPTSYTPTFIGFSGSLSYSAGYDITDTTCTYQGFCDFLGTPTFTSYAQVSMPIPAVNIFADIYGVPPHITGRTLGTAAFYDSSASIIYHGTCDVSVPHGGASTLRFFVGSPAYYLVTAANPFTWANGDGLWWKIQYAIT